MPTQELRLATSNHEGMRELTELFPEPGIYLLRHLITGKVYVGSSVDLRDRVLGHFRLLYRRVHRNRHLQAAWDQGGSRVFSAETLERLESTEPEALAQAEGLWIDTFRATDPRYGYNLLGPPIPGAVRHSDETRQRMRQVHLGKAIPAEVAAKISQARRGWDPPTEWRRKRAEAQRGRPQTAANRRALLAAHTPFLYTVVAPDGNATSTRNMRAFCREHGLNPSQMSKVARGLRRHHHRWTCTRVEVVSHD